MDRRNFIKIAGVAAAVGVTGCTGNGNGDGSGDGGDDGGDGDGGDGDGTGDGGNGGADSTVGQDGNATDMTGEDEVEVSVGAGPQGFKFDPADIVIDAGTTVRWVWTGEGGQHNVAHAEGEDPISEGEARFRSELQNEGEFTHTFEEPGSYDYVCTVHINQGMIGNVQVEGGGDGMEDGESMDDGDSMDGNESMDG